MRLGALVVLIVALTAPSLASAGGVDWSAYIDKDGSSKLPPQKTPQVASAQADDEPAPAKTTKASAKASKTKAKDKKAKAKARTSKKRRK